MNELFLFFLLTPLYLTAQQYTAIQKVNVIDVENGKVISNQTVLIKDSIIEAIGKNLKIPAGTKKINGKRKYLIPGLTDTHLHLHPYFNPKTGNHRHKLHAPLNIMIAYGVTGFREAAGSTYTKENIRLRDSIRSGKS